jgi:hypothetical protein
MPSAGHLATGEPAFGWCFTAIFPKLGTLTPLYVSTATLPDQTWETTQAYYFAASVKLASRATINDCSLVIKDYIEPNTAAICWNWWKDVGSSADGYINPPPQYKTDGTLIITNGRGAPVNTYHLRGCFPSAMQMGDGDYSSTDLLQVTMTIMIDSLTYG